MSRLYEDSVPRNVTRLLPKQHTEIIQGVKVFYTYNVGTGGWDWTYEVRKVIPSYGHSMSLRQAKKTVRERLNR